MDNKKQQKILFRDVEERDVDCWVDLSPGSGLKRLGRGM